MGGTSADRGIAAECVSPEDVPVDTGALTGMFEGEDKAFDSTVDEVCTPMDSVDSKDGAVHEAFSNSPTEARKGNRKRASSQGKSIKKVAKFEKLEGEDDAGIMSTRKWSPADLTLRDQRRHLCTASCAEAMVDLRLTYGEATRIQKCCMFLTVGELLAPFAKRNGDLVAEGPHGIELSPYMTVGCIARLYGDIDLRLRRAPW